MASAVFAEQSIFRVKDFDSYLSDSARIQPSYNLAMLFEEEVLSTSLFEFARGSVPPRVLGALHSASRLQNDVIVSIDSPLDESGVSVVDALKTQVIFNRDGSFAVYNEDFEKLAKGEVAEVTLGVIINEGKKGATINEVKLDITGSNEAPVVDAPLFSETNEEFAPYTVDLLMNVSDIDNGAVLSVANFGEAAGQGGWTLDGNTLTIDPNYFDALNDGEWGYFNFAYDVQDEYGAAASQTLTVTVEGVTDAPSLAVETSAGEAANEVFLRVVSEPHLDERVQLDFNNLDPDVTVYDEYGNDVTAGVADFYANPIYAGDHTFTLVMADDVSTPVDVTVAGYNAANEYIAEAAESIELLYDVNTAQYDVAFTNNNQNMWGDFGSFYFGWHEYIPILGNDFMQWDEDNEEWVENEIEYWIVDDIQLIDITYSSTQVNEILAGIAHEAIDAAKDVFDATAYVVDAGVQAAFDAAQGTLDAAYNTYLASIGFVDAGVQAAFDAAAAAYELAKDIYNAASYAFNTVAQGLYDAAYTVWEPFQTAWDNANIVEQGLMAAVYYPALGIWEAAVFAYETAEDIWDAAVYEFDVVATGLYDAARDVYDGAIELANSIALGIYEDAQDAFAIAEGIYEDAKAAVEAAAQAVYDGVSAEVDNMLDLANQIDFNTELEVSADLFARAGLQIDFVVDAGSVDTDVRYDLTAMTEYNQTTDMICITPTLYNELEDEYTPFSTISPNVSIYASLLYDVGANLEFYIDGELSVADTVIFDLSPGTDGLTFSPTVSTSGMNFKFDIDEYGNISIVPLDEVVTFAEMLEDVVDLSDTFMADPGELVLLDIDSAEAEAIALPFVDSLTKGIIEEISVQIPTVQTEGEYVSEEDLVEAIEDTYAYQVMDFLGLADDPAEQSFVDNINDYYYDENLDEVSDIFQMVNLEQLTSAFENATITLGDEIMDVLLGSAAFIDKFGDLSTFLSEEELTDIILEVGKEFALSLVDKALDIADGTYDTGTFVVVDLTDTSSEALFHYNTWDFNTDKLIEGIINGDPLSFLDYDYEDDLSDNTASLGLFASSGESDPFVSITVDVDAIAAVVISQIIKKVATTASAGAAAVIEAIPDELLNPFEQTLSLETLLKLVEVPEEQAKEITDYLNIEYQYTRVDADVITSADFSQDFTLTVDDMTYIVSLEDGTSLSFLASESDSLLIENASQYDVNGDGIISYDLQMVPTAMFSNDTELGLNIGLSLEFLKAALEAKVTLPIADLLGIEEPSSLWPTIKLPALDYTLGPLLEVEYEINGLDIDVYEARFDMDIGTDVIEGNEIDIQLMAVDDVDVDGTIA